MTVAFEGEKHLQEYVYDFAVDGGAKAAITLSDKSGYDPVPIGAIITDVFWYVETAPLSVGSATISLGNGDSAAGYFAATGKATLAVNVVMRAGETAGALIWDDTGDHKLAVYVADAADGAIIATIGTEVLTVGKIHVLVEYIMTRTNTR